MQRILIVEDEPRISGFISKGLKAAGYDTTETNSGTTAATLALHGDYDLILLDIGLPDIDGFEVLERLRGQGVTTPVIMLTARTSAADTVAGLTSGADDYMRKPFAFEELLARVKLRLATQPAAQPTATTLTHGELSFDTNSGQAAVAGQAVDLSAREADLLQVFLEHPGQILSRAQLLSEVWDGEQHANSNVVDVYVRYLRKKIGPERIQTVRAMGYRLAPVR